MSDYQSSKTERTPTLQILVFNHSFIQSEHWIDFYSIIRHEGRTAPNLDTLLTYAHHSILATAAKQK